MKRFYIELTEQAQKIYESWPRYDRGKNVSEAIIEYAITDIKNQLTEIEKRLDKLEEMKK